MLNVCFSRVVWSTLRHFFSGSANCEDVVYCPDYLPCGAIASIEAPVRKKILASWGISTDDRFEIEYTRFLKEVSLASSVRIWCSRSPHEQLGTWLTSSLVHTKNVTVCSLPNKWNVACLEELDSSRFPLLWDKFLPLDINEARANWTYIRGAQNQISLVRAQGEAVRPADISFFDFDILHADTTEATKAAIFADLAYRNRTGTAFSFELIHARAQHLLTS